VLEEFPIFEILQRDLSQRRDDLDDPVIRSRRFQHRHPSLELKLDPSRKGTFSTAWACWRHA